MSRVGLWREAQPHLGALWLYIAILKVSSLFQDTLKRGEPKESHWNKKLDDFFGSKNSLSKGLLLFPSLCISLIFPGLLFTIQHSYFKMVHVSLFPPKETNDPKKYYREESLVPKLKSILLPHFTVLRKKKLKEQSI